MLSNTKDFDYSASLDSSVALAPQRRKNDQLPGRDVRHNTSIIIIQEIILCAGNNCQSGLKYAITGNGMSR